MGVTRQYCGQVGNQKTCQIAVSFLSAATHQGSLAGGLPTGCVYRRTRRRTRFAGPKPVLPDDVTFQTKPETALQSPDPGNRCSTSTLSSSRRNVRSTLPLAVPNRPVRSIWPLRRHRRCVTAPRRVSAEDQHGLEPFFDQLLTDAGDCREAGAQRRGDLAVAPSFAALPCICFQQHARPGQLCAGCLPPWGRLSSSLSLFPR